MNVGDYPEHDKLRAVKDKSQAIGEFLDTCGMALCVVRQKGNNGESLYQWKEGRERDRAPGWNDYLDGRAEHNPDFEEWGEGFVLAPGSIQDKLAAHFEIDLDKIEAEKRAMLEAIRSAA